MIRDIRRILFSALLFSLLFTKTSLAQTDLSGIIGVPEHGHSLPVRFGFVNLDNGNLHLEIPLWSTPERGHPQLTARLVYESTFWNILPASPPYNAVYPASASWPDSPGWSLSIGTSDDNPGASTGILASQVNCTVLEGDLQGYINVYNSFTTINPQNTTRTFSFINGASQPIGDARCSYTAGSGYPAGTAYIHNNDPTIYGYPQNGTAYATDGSGYRLTISKANNIQTRYITSPHGTTSVTPNGNNFGWTGYDELGTALTPLTQQGSFQSWWGSTVGYMQGDAQPYSPADPVTITSNVPVWDDSSGTATMASYILTYEYIPVCTGTGSSDYCGGTWAIQSLSLPDESGTYSFTYDQGTSGLHYGELTGITLPTGGAISYSYGAPTCGNSVWCAGMVNSITDQGGNTTIAYGNPGSARGLSTNGPQVSYYPLTITYPPHVTTAGGTTTIRDKSVYSATFSTLTVTDYTGLSTPVRTTTTTTDNTERTVAVKTTWSATGESHEVDLKYADDPSVSGTRTYGQTGINLVALETEYNSGALVRSVQTTYLQDTASNAYVTQFNMIDYPSVVKVIDADGTTVVSQVQYTYDEYTANYCNQFHPTGLSGIPMLSSVTGAAGHDDIGHGVGFTARGNPTTISYSGANLTTPVVTHTCYDTLGNVTQSVDPVGNAIRYDYSDTFYESACLNSNLPTYAFPTTITDALGHQTVTKYYSCDRRAYSVQSPNDLIASPARDGTVFTYDTALRPHCTTYPDRGSTCYNYKNFAETDITTAISDGTSEVVQNLVDAFGRLTTQINQASSVETDTSFDSFGRVNSVSNPYFTPGSPSGSVYFAYDAFGRTTSQLLQDGNTQAWSYNGNAVTFTDEKGSQWQKTSDGLGRLGKVLEPNGATGAATMETDYGYDALNNLISVTQKGNATAGDVARHRSFTYDGLSRLICASNPENSSASCASGTGYITGTTGYTYYANGTVKTKTSPTVNAPSGSQTIGYCYDAVNRPLYKFYSSSFNCSSPSGYAASFSYDSSGVSGASNTIGLLTDEKSYAGSTLVSERQLYAYDPMGRILKENQITLGGTTTYSPAYTYNLVGEVTAFTDGATPVQTLNTQFPCGAPPSSWAKLAFSNCIDGAGRVTGVTSNWASYPTNLFSVPQAGGYTAAGQLQNWGQGPVVSNTPALSITQGYTPRLWLNSISAVGQIP